MGFPHEFDLEVTQEDIDHGKHGDCMACPAALAGQRHFARKDVAAGSFTFIVGDISLGKYGEDWITYTSKALEEFVFDFDNHKEMRPTVIHLVEIS